MNETPQKRMNSPEEILSSRHRTWKVDPMHVWTDEYLSKLYAKIS